MFKAANKETEARVSNTDLSNAKEVLKLSRDVENADLWKIYGRESEAGKMLFKLFGKGPGSIKIDYPKPKTQKTPLPFEDTRKTNLPCPQKTVIEYPAIKDNVRRHKIHAVDLIPKRKNEVEIKKEIEEFYSKPVVPTQKGVNRKAMVDDLQNKFKKQRGALPKGAELPVVQPNEEFEEDEITDEELQRRAMQKINKNLVKFTYEKPKEPDNSKGLTKDEEDNELEKLYEDIEAEIEDRQNYLEEIAHLDEPKLKEKVKKEIVERVAELQKIIQMLRRQG